VKVSGTNLVDGDGTERSSGSEVPQDSEGGRSELFQVPSPFTYPTTTDPSPSQTSMENFISRFAGLSLRSSDFFFDKVSWSLSTIVSTSHHQAWVFEDDDAKFFKSLAFAYHSITGSSKVYTVINFQFRSASDL
jgi:hypothetical protein